MKTLWIKDPSVHFALIGALLFGVNSLFQGGDAENSEEILITQQRIAHLAAVFERGWQRPPQQEELQGLIDDFIREEVLYREAVKMGLDKDDTVIRRRLRMKMEFLAKDLINAIEPNEQVLKSYYQQHIDKYTLPARYSFEQIFLDGEQRREVAEDARILLTKLTAGADPQKLGDSNLLQRSFKEISSERIDRLFGSDFSLQLLDLPAHDWIGPLTSAYGEHLVRITSYQPQQQVEFADIRADVLRDWQLDEQKNILQVQYETLLGNYRIHRSAPAANIEVANQ